MQRFDNWLDNRLRNMDDRHFYAFACLFVFSLGVEAGFWSVIICDRFTSATEAPTATYAACRACPPGCREP